MQFNVSQFYVYFTSRITEGNVSFIKPPSPTSFQFQLLDSLMPMMLFGQDLEDMVVVFLFYILDSFCLLSHFGVTRGVCPNLFQ